MSSSTQVCAAASIQGKWISDLGGGARGVTVTLRLRASREPCCVYGRAYAVWLGSWGAGACASRIVRSINPLAILDPVETQVRRVVSRACTPWGEGGSEASLMSRVCTRAVLHLDWHGWSGIVLARLTLGLMCITRWAHSGGSLWSPSRLHSTFRRVVTFRGLSLLTPYSLFTPRGSPPELSARAGLRAPRVLPSSRR